MFCPLCRAEYRPGFTHCSDCRVALVTELPERDAPSAYRILWKGENAGFSSDLSDELDAAGVGNAVIPLDLLFRNSRDYFDLPPRPFFGCAVCVPQRAFADAKTVLERMLAEHGAKVAPGRAEPAGETPGAARPPDLPLDWDEASATIEVFHASDQRAVDFRADSLRGIGIPSRKVPRDDGRVAVMVRPPEAVRAREIVRQIADGAEPSGPVPDELSSPWEDEPVRSYLLLWTIPLIYLLLAVIVLQLQRISPGLSVLLGVVAGLGAAVSNIGSFWMLYQAIRYEPYPLRFVLFSFVPFACIWYYRERYLRRRGVRRLPFAERMRMPPSSQPAG